MSKSINITVVVESLDANANSGAKANLALIKNLQKAGFHLKVLHYTRQEEQLENIPVVSIPENKINLTYFLSKLQLVIKRLTGININKSIEKRLGFSLAWFNDSMSIATALEKEVDFTPDYVLTLSYASSFRAHNALLKLPHWHAKWIAYVHDPFPQHSYPRPYDWVEPGHQHKRNFFLKITEKAKYLAYPSQLLAEWMESYYAPSHGKSIIIPHQIDTDAQVAQGIPDFFDVTKFNILHAGSMMSARNPDALIKAFLRLIEEEPGAAEQARLVFVGSRSIFHEKIEFLHNKYPQLYSSEGYISFDQVLRMQMEASVNVILEAKGPVSPFLPGKFPHCILSRKPVLHIGPAKSEVCRLLGTDYPYTAEIDDEQKIFQHLQFLYERWKNNGENEQLYSNELMAYLSPSYLKELISNLAKTEPKAGV